MDENFSSWPEYIPLEKVPYKPYTNKDTSTFFLFFALDLLLSLILHLTSGGGKDYAVVGSDSGRICILEYNAAKNSFERVHIETFGKSGCRRNIIIPLIKNILRLIVKTLIISVFS